MRPAALLALVLAGCTGTAPVADFPTSTACELVEQRAGARGCDPGCPWGAGLCPASDVADCLAALDEAPDCAAFDVARSDCADVGRVDCVR